ncbi:RNA polymerase sigma factor [Pedobacter sp. SYSU D00535]|uniref:RNA polymerase sigma factor n=1 Tax=Pedobacter sp. SYSU D00535 TaxID=2810308 RepID=UPI001A959C85|nr:sigma-70 family RNA polymerase sigma factor [Pedobacter sp. SYSU D00535]
MTYSSYNDNELWNLVQADDPNALRMLFDRYWTKLYATAFKLSRDQEVSQEIVHDIFLNIWQRRHQLVVDSFPHFLVTAVRYQYLNRSRSSKKPLVLVDDYEVFDTLATRNEGELRHLEFDFFKILREYLTPLPKRCREIFFLSRMDHLSNDEIASRLQISKRTVENQLSTALSHLKTALRNHLSIFLSIVLSLLSR